MSNHSIDDTRLPSSPQVLASLLVELPDGPGNQLASGLPFFTQGLTPSPRPAWDPEDSMQRRGWESGLLFTPTPFPEHPCEQQQLPACRPKI